MGLSVGPAHTRIHFYFPFVRGSARALEPGDCIHPGIELPFDESECLRNAIRRTVTGSLNLPNEVSDMGGGVRSIRSVWLRHAGFVALLPTMQ